MADKVGTHDPLRPHYNVARPPATPSRGNALHGLGGILPTSRGRSVTGPGTARPAPLVAPPDPHHAKDNAHDAINRLWVKQGRWDMAERAIRTIGDIVVPTGVHAISVSVVGGPGADMRRCWYLCLAAAFGRYNRSPVKALYSLNVKAVWDITGKACGVTLVYATNIDAGAVAGAAGKVGGLVGGLVSLGQGAVAADGFTTLLQRGPDQYTVGGYWPKPLLTVSQLAGFEAGKPTTSRPNWVVTDPTSGFGRYKAFRLPNNTGLASWEDAPKTGTITPYGRVDPDPLQAGQENTQLTRTKPPVLPDMDRIITTGAKLHPTIQPPRPPADGISRGSLVQLVSAALGVAGQWPNRPGSRTVTPVLGASGTFVDPAAGPTQPFIDPNALSPDGLPLPNGNGLTIPRVEQ